MWNELNDFVYNNSKNMTLTDKIIREAVDEYDKIFGENHHTICIGLKCECHKEVKSFLETKLRQMAEEIKERLTLKEEEHERHLVMANVDWNKAVKAIEELKKTI